METVLQVIAAHTCCRSMLVSFLCGGILLGNGCDQSSPPSAAPPGPAKLTAAHSNQPQVEPPPKPTAPRRDPIFWNGAEPAKRQTGNSTATARKPLPALEIDEARVAAAGIRKLAGQHLTLYTDLPSSAEVDGLCRWFDQAYPQWCQYFSTPLEQEPVWRMTGYLIQEKSRFQAAGLFPDSLPNFANAYSRDGEMWLYEQPSDYYRRHLLLHEGTHGFMYTKLQAAGPPWYMEGVAELLGTHRLQDDQLTMCYFPSNRDEVSHWGRIKIVKEGFEQSQAKFFPQVLDYSATAHLQVEAYGWCWAAAAFLHGHPRYRERFQAAAQLVLKPDFAEGFKALYAADWNDLLEEWQLFLGDLEYGHDLERWAVEFAAGMPLPAGGTKVRVAADRGWQSSKIQLEAGKSYTFKAQGRFQVAQQPQPWECEAGGVSIRYYKGMPLGVLRATMRTDDNPSALPSGMFAAAVVGLGTTLTPKKTGTLYFRINDSAAELSDNRGFVEVEIRPADTTAPQLP